MQNNFFRKIVITNGYAKPIADKHGILYMGVISFLLNPRLLDDVMSRR